MSKTEVPASMSAPVLLGRGSGEIIWGGNLADGDLAKPENHGEDGAHGNHSRKQADLLKPQS
jgi:hypothetical protein